MTFVYRQYNRDIVSSGWIVWIDALYRLKSVVVCSLVVDRLY